MKIRRNIALSDSGFIFNPTTGDSYSINPIGQEIFKKMKAGLEEKEIKSDILENFLIDEVTVEKDYYDFTSMLKTFKLIEDDN